MRALGLICTRADVSYNDARIERVGDRMEVSVATQLGKAPDREIAFQESRMPRFLAQRSIYARSTLGLSASALAAS